MARRILFVSLLISAIVGLTAVPAMAVTFTVDSTADDTDGMCLNLPLGDCTLREAITAANETLLADTINFNISGSGQHTIAVTGAPLPNIIDPVTIDGFSDPDDAGRIELDGSAANAGSAGLSVFGGGEGTIIKGLVINDFGDEAIQLSTGGNTVQGNYLGTDETGLVAEGNFVGISVSGTGNQIGGTGAGQGNVISGNDNSGVTLTATNTVLEGNLIGPGSDGSTDLGNGNQGVHLFSASTNNTIGGTIAAARNVISGNSSSGIHMGVATVTGNIVRGNYIGTKANGTEALPNNGGVRLGSGANANTIGGTAAGAGNLISGNSFHGVQVFDAASTGNVVQGNLIGTTSSGNAALGNASDGINIFDAPNTVIGGGAGARNVISGNGGDGVDISGLGADSNQVTGNYVGVGSDGTTDVGNGANGILLSESSFAGFLTGTAVGGSGSSEGNVVSGNGGDGIRIDGSRVQDTNIQGNIVGLAADGVTDRGNDEDGIESVAASGTTAVGGMTAAARNVFSGNGVLGVNLRGSSGTYVVQGNFIGMEATGTTAVSNATGGAIVQGVSSTVGGTSGVTVGGSCTGACNLISGNIGTGLITSSNQTIRGNYIGTDVTGLLDRGNTGNGIFSGTDSTVITIGGTAPEARNIISGNNSFGLSWGDSGASNDLIQGNYIGVGSDGTTAVGNSNPGISLGGDGNTIGGTAAGAGNVIAFNGGSTSPGVQLNSSASGNAIRGNSIHSNGGLGIDLDPVATVNVNDPGDGDTGANELQNFPLLATAQVTSGAVTANGTLNTVPSSTFSLDFYSSPTCNAAAPNNHGEGKTYLGELTPVTTNGIGDASFTFTSSGTPAVTAGDVITATATDTGGNTSEFSRCRVALGTPSPTISIQDTSVTEGDSGTTTASFTVTLSASSPDTVTVDYASADGTATSPSDYQAATGTVTFNPGQTSKTIDVTVNGDAVDEGTSETFQVNLSNAGGATIADGQAVGTITDDDAATIAIADATVAEGNSGTTTASFSVTLSTENASQVTVDWSTSDDTATAPGDYASASGTVTFTPGDTQETVDVTVNGDTLDEGNETFNVDLSNASGATIADALGVGTITDDDAATIAIADATVAEGNSGTTTASFSVTLSTESASQVTVDWATADGTATAPSDYAAGSGTVTFPAMDTSESITVTVNGDTAAEPNETFTVTLSNPAGATIADGQATGTITNDDATPPIPPPPPAPRCPGFESDPRPQIVGTPGSDSLTGTSAKEVICGLGGNDVLRGGGGNDLILGGGGKDRLAGQAGKDVLKGQAGNDRMNGGPGLDRCQGGPGKDTARACEKGRA